MAPLIFNDELRADVYHQVHQLASLHGSRTVQLALDAALLSQEVQRTDAEKGKARKHMINKCPLSRVTVTVCLTGCADWSENDEVKLSASLLKITHHNQQKLRFSHHLRDPLTKLDINFVDYKADSKKLVCMKSIAILREYSRLLSDRNKYEDCSSPVRIPGSCLGKLTLETKSESTMKQAIEGILRDVEVMSLFEKVCINLEDAVDGGKFVSGNLVDRLRGIVLECGIQHLELHNCSIYHHDLVALSYHGGSKFLTLYNVTTTSHPIIRPNLPRTFDAATMPYVDLVIPPGDDISPLQQNHRWNVIEFLPKIDELSYESGCEAHLKKYLEILRKKQPKMLCVMLDESSRIHQESFEKVFSMFASGNFNKIKNFQLESYEEGEEVQAVESAYARGLFKWAISNNCGWHSISFSYTCFPDCLIHALHETVDLNGAMAPVHSDRSRLRKFEFFMDVPKNQSQQENTVMLSRILRLVTTHLPYCYFIGEFNFEDDSPWTFSDESIDESKSTRTQIALQLERNHVGMALFEPTIYPSVPAGVWPIIMASAIASKDEKSRTPWTGIYCLIKELVEREVVPSPLSSIEDHGGVKRRKLSSHFRGTVKY